MRILTTLTPPDPPPFVVPEGFAVSKFVLDERRESTSDFRSVLQRMRLATEKWPQDAERTVTDWWQIKDLTPPIQWPRFARWTEYQGTYRVFTSPNVPKGGLTIWTYTNPFKAYSVDLYVHFRPLTPTELML